MIVTTPYSKNFAKIVNSSNLMYDKRKMEVKKHESHTLNDVELKLEDYLKKIEHPFLIAFAYKSRFSRKFVKKIFFMEKQPFIADSQMLQRLPDMVFSHIDDEVVMMSIETGEYFGLNPVASRIWELLEKPHTFRRLIDLLMLEFDIDEPTCQNDVMNFLNQLMGKRLVITVNETI